MEVTNDMLAAAIKKAVEAGLLPRHASEEEMRINGDLIRAVLQAAAEAAPRKQGTLAAMQGEVVRRAGETLVFRTRYSRTN